MSHVETGQTKVSLSMLLRIAYVLKRDLNYFLLDTPYAQGENILNDEISKKLEQCNPTALLAVNKMIEVFLEQQNTFLSSKESHSEY